MGRNQLSSLARKLVVVGLLSWSSGCSLINFASPSSKTTWTENGHRQRITPSQEADVQIAFARTAEREGNYAQAEAAYLAALKRDKSRGDAHLHLANILTLKGEYRQAQEEYQKAIEASPGNADVFCDMGYSLYLQRKWVDSERNLQQAIAIQPDHPRAHNNLALVLAHTNRSEQALAEFRRAGNSLTDAHVNLALSLSVDKRWPEAREAYRRALASAPDSAIARSRLLQLDHLIARNEGRAIKKDALQDVKTVQVSARPDAVIPPSLARPVQRTSPPRVSDHPRATLPPPRSFRAAPVQRNPAKIPALPTDQAPIFAPTN